MGEATGEVRNYCSFACRNEDWKQLEPGFEDGDWGHHIEEE